MLLDGIWGGCPELIGVSGIVWADLMDFGVFGWVEFECMLEREMEGRWWGERIFRVGYPRYETIRGM